MYMKQENIDVSASKKPIVVDDIDQCFRNILGIKNLDGFTIGFDEFEFNK